MSLGAHRGQTDALQVRIDQSCPAARSGIRCKQAAPVPRERKISTHQQIVPPRSAPYAKKLNSYLIALAASADHREIRPRSRSALRDFARNSVTCCQRRDFARCVIPASLRLAAPSIGITFPHSSAPQQNVQFVPDRRVIRCGCALSRCDGFVQFSNPVQSQW